MFVNQPITYILPPNIPPSWACAWGEDEYGVWTEFEFKGVVQRMRWITPGTFMMGAPEEESERMDRELLHEVEISRGFWLADTTCTQALWKTVMGQNPSKYQNDEHPVENVSWEDCQVFFEKIDREVPGLELCLPTEAQWEYACRAGTQTAYWFGDMIDGEQANFAGSYSHRPALADGSILANGSLRAGGETEEKGGTAPVKTYPSNSWGLYEMHGNVLEWCQDWYAPYENVTVIDPKGPDKGVGRVLHGGSWNNDSWGCRSAYRRGLRASSRDNFIGFRFSRGQ